MQATTKDFTVAIIGGGMVGLTLTIALTRSGIKCDLFESAHRFGEVGAGVGIGPNAIRALDALGVLDAIKSHSGQEPVERPFAFVSGIEEPGSDGTYEYIYEYPTTKDDSSLGIHRPVFLDALVPLLPPHIVHFDKHCSDIVYLPHLNKHQVIFADGTTHQADIVIGADGIRSVVRNVVVGQEKNISFSGWKAYRALIPLQELKDAGVKMDVSRTLCVVGPHKHLITFTIQNKKTVNVVAFSNPPTTTSQTVTRSAPLPPPWVKGPIPTSTLLDEYKGWNQDTHTILQHMNNPSMWCIHDLNPILDTFINGKIALIGDAAHASTPHLGAGVGQGFEDVYVLWKLLIHPETNGFNVEEVLKAYDSTRRARANSVVTSSYHCGKLYESYGLSAPSGFDTTPGGRDKMRDVLVGIWDAVWHHDLNEDVMKAVKMLTMDGVFR